MALTPLCEPSVTIDQILASKSLPSLPAVGLDIVRLCRCERTNIDDLAKVVSLDPSLAANVMRLANSSKYSRRQEVTQLNRACVVLGLKTVKIMSLSFSLSEAMVKPNVMSAFDFDKFWHHSIATAIAGREFCRLTKQSFGDEAFFCGLVCRIGQLVISNAATSVYDQIIASSFDSLPTSADERAVLGFDHRMVGSELLRKWDVPDVLVKAVQGEPAADDESTTHDLCRIVEIADNIGTVITGLQKGEAYQNSLTMAQQQFGLAECEFEEFIKVLREQVAEMAALLNVDIEDTTDYADYLEEARQQIIDITMDTQHEFERLRTRESRLVTETQKLQIDALTDALTGIPNRREFDRVLNEMVVARRSAAKPLPMAVFMVDVDHFKSFNDRFGHLAGDAILRRVAWWMKSVVRPTDIVCRYGGEEFGVILPNVGSEDVLKIAERVRRSVEEGAVEYEGELLQVTVSVGGVVVDRSREITDERQLIRGADECLYLCKGAGRNQVMMRLYSE